MRLVFHFLFLFMFFQDDLNAQTVSSQSFFEVVFRLSQKDFISGLPSKVIEF